MALPSYLRRRLSVFCEGLLIVFSLFLSQVNPSGHSIDSQAALSTNTTSLYCLQTAVLTTAMPPSTERLEQLSPDTLKQLRQEAKTRYYDMRVCDLEVDVDLETYIYDYIEDYYRAQHPTAPASPSITTAKRRSAMRRLFHRMHEKEHAAKRSLCLKLLPPEVVDAITHGP